MTNSHAPRRGIGALDARIARAETRLDSRRAHLEAAMSAMGQSTRDTVASPKVLLGVVALGFVLDRAGRAAGRRSAQPETRSAFAGILGAVAIPLLRSAFNGGNGWASELLREVWERRRQRQEAARPARGPHDASMGTASPENARSQAHSAPAVRELAR